MSNQNGKDMDLAIIKQARDNVLVRKGVQTNDRFEDSNPNYVDWGGTVEGLDMDFNSLVDKGQSCGLAMTNCAAEDSADLQCARLGMNITAALTSSNTTTIARDFNQGGRGAAQAFNLLHHLSAARNLPDTYYSAVAFPNQVAAPYQWLIGFATEYPDLLTAGFTVQGAQPTVNATRPTVKVFGEFNGTYGNTPVASVPPLGFQRDVQIVRGFLKQPLAFDVKGQSFAIYLHWMWRAEAGMDTAIVDLARPAPLPPAVAAIVRPSWAPGTTGPLYGFVSVLTSTSLLFDVRCYPMGNNTQRLSDMAAAIYLGT